ncbi:hypothetical protein ACJX0J_018814 [Zea mays]
MNFFKIPLGTMKLILLNLKMGNHVTIIIQILYILGFCLAWAWVTNGSTAHLYDYLTNVFANYYCLLVLILLVFLIITCLMNSFLHFFIMMMANNVHPVKCLWFTLFAFLIIIVFTGISGFIHVIDTHTLTPIWYLSIHCAFFMFFWTFFIQQQQSLFSLKQLGYFLISSAIWFDPIFTA